MKGYHGTNISERTTKMGNILSFSTLPYRMCRKELPCYKDCYAAKICRLRKTVAMAWGNNTMMIEAGRYDEIASDIKDVIAFKHAKLFRWFVGGDIYNTETLDMMIAVANSCPTTQFMAFTKCYDLLPVDGGNIPNNLNIVLSAWKDYQPSDELKQRYAVCYFDDGEEDCQIPMGTTICGGDCEHCQLCFNLKAGESVCIRRH